MKVDVYFNLHRRTFSVRSRESGSYGKVIAHMDSLMLRDVEFVVNEGGRQRVLKEGRKNVHAYLRGTLLTEHEQLAAESATEASQGTTAVTYNPYMHDTFVCNNRPILRSALVFVKVVDGRTVVLTNDC